MSRPAIRAFEFDSRTAVTTPLDQPRDLRRADAGVALSRQREAVRASRRLSQQEL